MIVVALSSRFIDTRRRKSGGFDGNRAATARATAMASIGAAATMLAGAFDGACAATAIASRFLNPADDMAQRRAIRWQRHFILFYHLAERSGLVVECILWRRGLFDCGFIENIVVVILRQSFFGSVGVAFGREVLALANGRVGGFGVEGHCWTHVAGRIDWYDLATRREEMQLVRRSGGRAWRSQPIGHCIAEAAPGVVARMAVVVVVLEMGS